MAKATSVGIGSINPNGSINKVDQLPCDCGNYIPLARYRLGYRQCLSCGEKTALKRKFTVAPMPKSNYILITDLSLLKGLNSSHKGGVT
jgi:hypothetical protein